MGMQKDKNKPNQKKQAPKHTHTAQKYSKNGIKFEHSRITGLRGKGEDISFNFSLPLPPASQTLRH